MDICPANCCYVDEDMFKKVISNIVANAVQNTPATGEVKIWSEQLMDHVRICILNTPVTLSGEHVSKLFDPFYRVDKARTRKDGRSGLGLTIVKKTLDAMGCDYQLIKRNDGILFWFDVPRLEK
jgi:two-component system sensor histidine kinase VanS